MYPFRLPMLRTMVGMKAAIANVPTACDRVPGDVLRVVQDIDRVVGGQRAQDRQPGEEGQASGAQPGPVPHEGAEALPRLGAGTSRMTCSLTVATV